MDGQKNLRPASTPRWRARLESALLTALPVFRPVAHGPVAVATVLGCVGIFLVDFLTPGEVSPEVLYGIVLLGSLWAGRPLFSLALGGLCTFLIPLGHLLYPAPTPWWAAMANRVFGLATVWAVTVLVLALHAALAQLREGDAALRAATRFMDTVVGSLGEGLVAYDRELRFTLWNRFMERLTGVRATDVLGRRAGDVFPQLLEQGAEYRLTQALAGEVVQAPELRYLRPDTGEPLWARVTYCPQVDGGGHIVGVLGLIHDLTRRKHLEEARDRYHLLAEAAADSILFVRPRDGQILEANAAAIAAYRYSRPELLRRTVYDLRAPDTRAAVSDQLARAATTGVRFETFHRRSDGTCFPVEVQARGTLLAGEPIVLSVIRDITERRRAEQALRLSEEKFAKAFGANPAAIALTRVSDGVILDVNETALQLMGYGRAEVLGRSVVDLGIWVHPAERTRYVEELQRAGCVREREVQFADRTGSAIDALLSAELITVGGETLILSTFLDMTERQRAQAALRESEDRLRFALETSHTGAWDLDLATRTVVRSQDHDRIFGYPDLLPTWTHDRFLDHVLPEDREPVEFAFRQAVATQGTWNVECRIRRLDGALRWIWAAGRYRAGGRPRMTGVVRDITERKEAEAELRATLAAKDDALATNQTLLREVHHRVKNNLQMLCDMLYLQMEGMADAEKAEVLRDTYGRIYAVARLHEQLYQTLQSGRVALHEYLARLVQGFRAVYPSIPVRVEAAGAVTLDLDRAIQVGLLVNELVTNALKHGFPGGRTGEVVVRLQALAEHLELEVRDDGVGIPSDLDLEHAKSLGLRIVRILSRRLEGALTIANRQGTAFTLRFPLQAELPVEPK